MGCVGRWRLLPTQNCDCSCIGRSTISQIQGDIVNNGEIVILGGDTLTIVGSVTNSLARLNNGLICEGTTRFEGAYNGGALNSDPEFNPDALVVLALRRNSLEETTCRRKRR